MNHTITDTTDTNILTAEEFLRQARRWAAAVRNAARRNTLRFTKGKKVTSITKKSGKVERKRDMAGVGGGLRPAPCSRQVREPAPQHPPLRGGLVRRTHRPQRGTPLRPRSRILG